MYSFRETAIEIANTSHGSQGSLTCRLAFGEPYAADRGSVDSSADETIQSLVGLWPASREEVG
jgi:hypothetical protein